MGETQQGLIELEATEVAALLEAGAITLVDVREPEEWEAERIPGAVLHPMSDFEPEAWPFAASDKVVIMCLGGVRSAAVAKRLLKAGLDRAVHLKGGLTAWKNSGLPVAEALDAAA